jgi:hypothetical protein
MVKITLNQHFILTALNGHLEKIGNDEFVNNNFVFKGNKNFIIIDMKIKIWA